MLYTKPKLLNKGQASKALRGELLGLKIVDFIYFYFASHFNFNFNFLFLNLGLGISITSHMTDYKLSYICHMLQLQSYDHVSYKRI